MKSLLLKPGLVPGVLTVVGCLITWQIVSLFFLPIFVPGPITLIDRMIEVYGDPASYLVVGQTLIRIVEGLVVCMIIGTAIGLAMGAS